VAESLPIMLKALRLPAFGQHYNEYQQLAIEKAWGHSQYLSKLCEQEIAQRFQTRIRSWTREAKLPQGKSFATLQVNELPKAIQQTVIGLKDNTQWALQADNVLLIGPSGVGKIAHCCSTWTSPDRTGHSGEMDCCHCISATITTGQAGTGFNGW